MTRWKACAIHFSISLLIFLLLLAVIWGLWYPGILFSIDRGWNGLRILIGVDLVMGPLLTLAVFRAGKPGLKFDLTCIAIAQALCIAGGMWVVQQERPLAVVLAYDTIYSVSAKEFADYGQDPAILDSIPGSTPKFIYVDLPENPIAADIANVRSTFGLDQPLFIQADLYKAMPPAGEELASIFRFEKSVRDRFAEDYSESLAETCQLSQFISAVTSGYVCFDSTRRALTSFYVGRSPAVGSEAISED